LATGIIALGADQQNFRLLANILFGIAAIAFLVLFIMTVLRLVLYPKLLFSDLTHHSLGFSFLTLVAAINVLGRCAADIANWWTIAEFCWGIGLLLLVILIYSSLFGVILRSEKPPMGTGINGTWFLLTVSLESVAVLGGTLLGHTGPNEGIELVTASAFTLGIVLYLVVVTMLFQRWSFLVLDPADAQPPSWIAAGAAAIMVLAGSTMLGTRELIPRFESLAPFLEGMIMLAWATATFWLPVLVGIGIWRHVIRRVPLSYHPSYWALVFPLGMYGAATYEMISVLDLESLSVVPQAALIVALFAWVVVFTGMLRQPFRPKSRAS
jgi:tellurite resistance protein TehA-like permease